MAETGVIIEFEEGATEGYDPRRYEFDGIATGVPTLDEVGEIEVRQYEEQGYLVVERAFSPQRVNTAGDALMELIDRSALAELDCPQYAIQVATSADVWQTLDQEARRDAVRKLTWFTGTDTRLAKMAHDPDLASVLERLTGEPNKMFQDMALLKPPMLGREKAWHQDHAYFRYDLATKVVGVWIALDEATPENGCMRIFPGLHKRDPFIHFKRRDWQICDSEIDSMDNRHCLAVPLKPGGCLFLSSLLPHGTPVNTSADRRRALQFHYLPLSAVSISDDQRLAVFGSEGKNVEC